jgi:excisionase family DNA binding protein
MTATMTSATERQAFTVQEVASVLGLSRWAAYEAVKRGDIPSVRIGGRVLIPKGRLQALLDGEGNGTGVRAAESRT